MVMGEQSAANVLKLLRNDEVQKIGAEMTYMGEMSTDEVRGHTGIVTPKPVPERCLRVRSSPHEGRRVGVGCLEEDPRAVSMVERVSDVLLYSPP